MKFLIQQTRMTWPDAMSLINKKNEFKIPLSFCKHVSDKMADV